VARGLWLALSVALLCPAAASAAGDPLRSQQWNLDMVEADAAWTTTTGAGATVAIVDSGAQADHPDLAGRLIAGYDVVENDATPQDANGHGTHVAGIAGATSGNGTGVAGVAPSARLMPVRVLDADGEGSADGVAAGIDWARTHGADVINLSLGSEVPIVGATQAGALDAAMRRALDAGIVVVAAAGNNGVPVCEQPAASAGLVCVGAVDRRGEHALYSSFGSGLGLVAPGGSALPTAGEGVLSTAEHLRLRVQRQLDRRAHCEAPHARDLVVAVRAADADPVGLPVVRARRHLRPGRAERPVDGHRGDALVRATCVALQRPGQGDAVGLEEAAVVAEVGLGRELGAVVVPAAPSPEMR
jgi:subtilisin family serine protease